MWRTIMRGGWWSAVTIVAALVIVFAGLFVFGLNRRGLVLPVDPVDRAATCGIMSALDAHASTDVMGQLSAYDQGRMIHFAMLAASTDRKRFDEKMAARVYDRIWQLADPVAYQRWQTAVIDCRRAFPESMIDQPKLPARPVDQAIQCEVLADYMGIALGAQGGLYRELVDRYAALARRAEAATAPLLARANIAGADALSRARVAALADAAHRGPPMLMLDRCEAAFPPRDGEKQQAVRASRYDAAAPGFDKTR